MGAAAVAVPAGVARLPEPHPFPRARRAVCSPGPSTPECSVIGLGLAMAAQGQDGTPPHPKP
jgi:hypothetical protein